MVKSDTMLPVMNRISARIESLKAERSSSISISWKNYDNAYEVWKKYKRRDIERPQALQIIDSKYGIYLFFLLYPLYKTMKPFRKLLKSLKKRLSGCTS